MSKFKRYDVKKLLANPDLRRHLIVEGTIATQAREGIEVSREQAENSYYVVTEGERGSFFGLIPFRGEAGVNDGRYIEFVKALRSHSPCRQDVALKDFLSIEDAPLAYDRLSLVGFIFRENPSIEPNLGIARQGKATGDDSKWVRCHWEVVADTWVPFAKGGSFSRFYADVYLCIDWSPSKRAELKSSGNGLPSEDLYFKPGLTWPRRTAKGLSIRRMPAGCVFADKGPAFFGKNEEAESFVLSVVNSRLFEFLFTCRTSFSWEVGILRGLPVPTSNLKAQSALAALACQLYETKAAWDKGNEICTQFDQPWVLKISSHTKSCSLFAALDEVLDREIREEAELAETYSQLNTAVYRLYGVSDVLRAKIDAAIGERPPELVWPQMEGKDRDQKRREHVDRLLTYLVKQILTEDEDHLVCLQRVAHESPLLERLRIKIAACFPEQDPSTLETEVVNELKKKTKGYHRAESLAEWLHDVFFEVHNSLYEQRPILWHLASSQTRTEPGFACIVHAHHFDRDALAKLRSVYIRDRVAVLRREAAQAGDDGKADVRLDLLALAEEVEAYDAKLALLQEGTYLGPEGSERDYRILTPWKKPGQRPHGWLPDVDDGIKVNLAPLARTNLLRRRLKLGEVKDED